MFREPCEIAFMLTTVGARHAHHPALRAPLHRRGIYYSFEMTGSRCASFEMTVGDAVVIPNEAKHQRPVIPSEARNLKIISINHRSTYDI